MDINNAFLNETLQEEVFMIQPSGFSSPDNSQVFKLYKVAYVLKQAHRQWYEKLHQALFQFGFMSNKCDNSLCVYSH